MKNLNAKKVFNSKEEISMIAGFYNFKTNKRWKKYLKTSKNDLAQPQVRIFAGKNTWEDFREASKIEHQAAIHNSDIFNETWATLIEIKAPKGWSSLKKVKPYRDEECIFASSVECMVVRDNAASNKIIGFVNYLILSVFDNFNNSEKLPKFYDIHMSIDIDLIYVLPSYRKKSIGLTLNKATSLRFKEVIKHLLENKLHNRNIRITDIYVSGDCDSEEGCDWVNLLEKNIKIFIKDFKNNQEYKRLLNKTKIICDYGY